MANLAEYISGFVAGDDLELRRTVTGIPSGQTLAQAWLTVKAARDDIDPGVLQKSITPTDVPGTGQITDTGASGTGEVRFDLGPDDTDLLYANPNTPLYFDIQIKTSADKLYTPFIGRIVAARDITRAR